MNDNVSTPLPRPVGRPPKCEFEDVRYGMPGFGKPLTESYRLKVNSAQRKAWENAARLAHKPDLATWVREVLNETAARMLKFTKIEAKVANDIKMLNKNNPMMPLEQIAKMKKVDLDTVKFVLNK